MKKSFIKNIIVLLKGVYVKVLPLSFSLGFLFLSLVSLSLLNNFTSYLALILLLMFFLPLLLSVQLLCTRIFAYKEEVDYKEIYKQLRVYFSPIFNGCYKVFSAFLFSFLALFISFSIFEYAVLVLNPNLIELILIDQEQFVMEFMNIPYFDYVFTLIFGFITFVFLWRIFANIPTPFFSYFSGLQKRHLRRFLSYLRHNKIYPYKRRLWSIGYPFIILFLLPYFISSSICYYYSLNMNVSIIVGLVLPTILCCLYFPIYVKGCHIIVAELKPVGVNFLKDEVKRESVSIDNNPSLSEEEKEILRKKYKDLEDLLNNDLNRNNKDEKRDE